jgi:hypothetical protein
MLEQKQPRSLLADDTYQQIRHALFNFYLKNSTFHARPFGRRCSGCNKRAMSRFSLGMAGASYRSTLRPSMRYMISEFLLRQNQYKGYATAGRKVLLSNRIRFSNTYGLCGSHPSKSAFMMPK